MTPDDLIAVIVVVACFFAACFGYSHGRAR